MFQLTLSRPSPLAASRRSSRKFGTMFPSDERRATIYDVARLAEVSHQTVARVIHAQANVAQHTRERVLQAIHDLDFRPNRTARSLIAHRTALLGVVVGAQYAGSLQIVQEIEGRARIHGYELLLIFLKTDQPQDSEEALQRLQQFGVAGVLLLMPQHTNLLGTMLERASLPAVMVKAPGDALCTTVSVDELSGGTLATEHLIQLGHRRILYLGGEQQWNGDDQRLQGYRQTLRLHAVPEQAQLEGDWSAGSGYLATQRMLTIRPTFTAIFAGNDQMALGAVAALRHAGHAVPEHVSVVGFGNTPESTYFGPGLTTVEQDVVRLGRTGVDELLRALRGDATVRHLVLQPQLVKRRSTAQPAS